jgi:hypothetical protein
VAVADDELRDSEVADVDEVSVSASAGVEDTRCKGRRARAWCIHGPHMLVAGELGPELGGEVTVGDSSCPVVDLVSMLKSGRRD